MVAYTWAFRELRGREKTAEVHFLLPSGVEEVPLVITDAEIEEFRHKFRAITAYLNHPKRLFLPNIGEECKRCPCRNYCIQELSRNIEKLREEIKYHRYRYHVLYAPVITDAEYDQLVTYLRHLEASYSALKSPGDTGDRGSHVEQPFSMPVRGWSNPPVNIKHPGGPRSRPKSFYH